MRRHRRNRQGRHDTTIRYSFVPMELMLAIGAGELGPDDDEKVRVAAALLLHALVDDPNVPAGLRVVLRTWTVENMIETAHECHANKDVLRSIFGPNP